MSLRRKISLLQVLVTNRKALLQGKSQVALAVEGLKTCKCSWLTQLLSRMGEGKEHGQCKQTAQGCSYQVLTSLA